MNLVHERLKNKLLQNFHSKHTVDKYELFCLYLWICPLFIAGRTVCLVAFKLHHFAYREGSVRFSRFNLIELTGVTQLILIPFRIHSTAKLMVKFWTPARAAPVWLNL